jgi:hypothetical protein
VSEAQATRAEVADRSSANAEAVARMTGAEPVLIDVAPAGQVVPGMTERTILTSGPPMPWPEYYGGQRNAVIYGALYEGLASDPDDADAKLSDGRITLAATHDHSCVGSVAGIYTASMPVFVVENTVRGNRAYCNFYEGESRHRLNYGSYNDEVRAGLDFLRDELAPVLRDVIRASGGIALKPLIGRALRMGDELHSRNTAATTLFARELTPHFIGYAVRESAEPALRALRFLFASDYSFPPAVDGQRKGHGGRRQGRSWVERGDCHDDQLPELRDQGQRPRRRVVPRATARGVLQAVRGVHRR